MQKQNTKEINTKTSNSDTDPLFERKLENATEGLSHDCFNWLKKVANDDQHNNKENAVVIANYIMSMNAETNLSDNYRRLVIILLSKLSIYFDNEKPFKSITRGEILKF